MSDMDNAVTAMLQGAMVLSGLIEKFTSRNMEMPYFSIDTYAGEMTLTYWGYSLDDVKLTRKVIGGRWDKDGNDHTFTFSRRAASNVVIKVCASRNVVCERIVTGTEVVEEKDYSNVPTHYVEREIVEWKCNA